MIGVGEHKHGLYYLLTRSRSISHQLDFYQPSTEIVKTTLSSSSHDIGHACLGHQADAKLVC